MHTNEREWKAVVGRVTPVRAAFPIDGKNGGQRTDPPYQHSCEFVVNPMILVVLTFHLRNLACIEGEVQLEVAQPITVQSVLEALETKYPVLRGTIRDHGTLKRRPFVRFFACKEDFSLEPPETRLPAEIVNGKEPFLIIGAIAGG